MIISISGAAGSGKTTIAKMLAEKLGWPRYYIGGIRRKKALERNMTLEEYNKLGETDPGTDAEVDEYQKELGRKKNNFIIEGRTSWHFIPHSFKIYFDVDEKTAAERIYNDLAKGAERNEAKELHTYEDVLKSLRERRENDIRRYKKYYNINAYDKKNYDCVIDASNLSINEVFEKTYGIVRAMIDKN